ncbi:hypothetical protein MTR_8g091430 [Medicago truncatula]|uniref:Uncharacterized protein n=1 Tax=Medicago truncatula TaxID=3880 RepID=G7LAE9_MEDTR|nr:hypothetical protein MTR_8g091430 [Medicago truncatula]
MVREVQHKDFSGGHESWYYFRPSTFNCEVLMRSGTLILNRLQLTAEEFQT